MKEKLELQLKLQGVDEAIEKAEKYVSLLKEAKTLADELASVDFEIETT